MYLEEFSSPQPVVAPEKKVMLDVCPWPVHAGFPSPAADHARKQIDLNEHLIRNKEATFIFRVKGDSMVGIGNWSINYLATGIYSNLRIDQLANAQADLQATSHH